MGIHHPMPGTRRRRRARRRTRHPFWSAPSRQHVRPSVAVLVAGALMVALGGPFFVAAPAAELADDAGAGDLAEAVAVQAAAAPGVPASPQVPVDGHRIVARYVVHRGDAVSTIADLHAVSVDDLASANQLAPPFPIVTGQTLAIPAPSAPASPPPEQAVNHPERAALEPLFARWATEYDVPPALLEAVCWHESRWRADARSEDGAIGLCQLLPDTAAWVADRLLDTPLDPWVVDDNVRMSARFLRWLLDRTGEDHAQTLASYYQGHRSVADRGWYGDTIRYVDSVLALRWRFEGQDRSQAS